MKLLLTFFFLSLSFYGQRKAGSPLDHLPKNIEVLTYFGERADISPDNQRVAFMGKSFGDAFVLDLKTRILRCLTCNVPGAAFLRDKFMAFQVAKSADEAGVGSRGFCCAGSGRDSPPAANPG